jgi:hypothetical protein
MSATREETKEILENLSGMSAELIRATQDAKKLKKSLVSIGNVVEDKRYEILSRFLSGTGAWKILNKVKAFTQTISELSDRSEAKMAKEAKTLQAIGKLAEKQAKFAGLAEIARAAEKGDAKAIAQLMKEIPEVRGLAIVKGQMAAIKQYKDFVVKSNKVVKDTIKTLSKPDMFKKTKAAFGKIFAFKDKVKLGTRFKEVTEYRGEEKRIQESLPFYEDIALKDIDFSSEKDTAAEFTRVAANLGDEIGAVFHDVMGKLEKTFYAGFEKANAYYQKALMFSEKHLESITKLIEIGFITDSILELSSVITTGFSDFYHSDTKLKDIQERASKIAKASYDIFKKLTIRILPIFMGFVLFFAAFFVLYRILKNGDFIDSIVKTLQVLIDGFSFAFSLVWEGLSSIIEGFKTGDFFKVLEGVAYILGGLAVAALTLLGTLLVGALTLVYSVLKGTIGALLDRLTSSFSKALSTLFYIGAAIAGLVFFFGGGFVAVLIAAILTGIGYLIEKFVPFSKGGTVSNNGMQLVGEKGPELVKLPVGSRVFSNKDSKNMVSGGSTTNNITVQVSGRVGASDQEIKDIARKVSREIGLQMNRTGSTAVRF